MRPPTINDRKLLRLIDSQKKSQAQAAKSLGVSRQAVSKRLQELRGKTTKVVVAKKIEQVVDRKIDAMDQLQKINDDANEILDLLMAWNRGDETALQVLESQVTTKKVRVGDQEEFVKEFKFKDPRALALQAMAEIRNQLKLQLEIFQTLFDLRAAEEFQQEVLATIGQASPELRRKIIDGLRKRKTLRNVVSLV